MKKVLLVYNPVAGEGAFKSRLENIIVNLQRNGFQVTVHITNKNNDLDDRIIEAKDFIDTVVIAGGDGTIHKVLNSLFRSKVNNLPVGIIPIGTSNDIANYFDIPLDIEEATALIVKGVTKLIDIGEVNGIYFANVASGGLMTEVPHKTNVRFKNITGKLAYYIKGIEQIPSLKDFPVVISTPERTVKESILLFIVLNGTTAGGFKDLAPDASMTDGKLDLLVFKSVNISKLPGLFLKILRKEHVPDPSLIYFQTKGPIFIECPSETGNDVDGEKGPGFPMEIKLHPAKLSLIC